MRCIFSWACCPLHLMGQSFDTFDRLLERLHSNWFICLFYLTNNVILVPLPTMVSLCTDTFDAATPGVVTRHCSSAR